MSRWLHKIVAAALLAALARGASAADLDGARKLCGAGKYADCIEAVRAAEREGETHVDWSILLLRALLATGHLDEAAAVASMLELRFDASPRALLAAHDVHRARGDTKKARAALEKIRKVAAEAGGHLVRPEDLVAAGVAALRLGDEPKAVLDAYFEAAVKEDATCREAYLAAGALALDKHDDQLAATWFKRGLDKLGPDADLHHGLARAYTAGDRKAMLRALDAALHLNPHHVPALLLRAEHEIDAEDYVAARRTLERALAVDGGRPEAWAFRAVLGHLANDPAAETQARGRALARWAKDPAVDTLIGRKLSEKYRFTEGAAYQRRALGADPAHLPAKIQLAQDLLRLGQEGEGWALAEEVHKRDGYDVVAFNLVTLRGHLAKLKELRNADFVVRMDGREADIYGDDAMALLRQARAALDRRWGFAGARPVRVEIYPEQSDFAVRTFGVPGGSGYLGVCFGTLITANSPAGNGPGQANWRAVLWHEYTHVITLGLSRNKMPRWLSEGISVWEELRHDPTWGQRMTPRYRDMVLGGELTPVGKLSGAFLEPKDGEHLIFAYYESALVVEFLVARYGEEALRAVLRDLGEGKAINAALEARAAPLAKLEPAFAAFAEERARALAPKADLARPEPRTLDDDDAAAIARWLAKHPNSVWGLVAEGRRLAQAGQWAKAKPLLEKAIALFPEQKGGDGAYPLLAEVHRKLGETADERRVLARLAALTSDAAPVYARLVELDEGARDFAALGADGERLLGVNPMTATAWRAVGRAAEAQGGAGADRAIAAFRKLLALDPPDPADAHLRLARLLRGRDPRAARRHVMDALALAPRFRDAHKLLLELEGGRP